jgi:hypothetical protein
MKRGVYEVIILLAIGIWLSAGLLLAQQTAAPTGPAVHMVVTAEARHGSNPPEIGAEDVMVFEGRDRDKVESWTPLRGDHAGREFFILLDDGSSVSLGSQLEDIKQFINAQPATTKIGVGYMQNGIAQVLQEPTADHAAAGKALRLPLGNPGINASPYFALSDLIKKWPDNGVPRSVLMITDGIDLYWGAQPQDPYVDTAIEQAQKAGITVSAIYTPGVGHYEHSYWRVYWGQIYLSQVADETGGESYYIGFTGAPVAFSPYLEDITRRLNNQYLLTFIPKPQKKAGMQKVRLRTEVPNVDLVGSDRVFVPAGE